MINRTLGSSLPEQWKNQLILPKSREKVQFYSSDPIFTFSRLALHARTFILHIRTQSVFMIQSSILVPLPRLPWQHESIPTAEDSLQT